VPGIPPAPRFAVNRCIRVPRLKPEEPTELQKSSEAKSTFGERRRRPAAGLRYSSRRSPPCRTLPISRGITETARESVLNVKSRASAARPRPLLVVCNPQSISYADRATRGVARTGRPRVATKGRSTDASLLLSAFVLKVRIAASALLCDGYIRTACCSYQTYSPPADDLRTALFARGSTEIV
jgi:hypothetical protein